MAQKIQLVDSSGNPINSGNPLAVNATLTPTANQRVNAQSGDFVAGSIVDLASLLTSFAELLLDTDNLATLVTNTTGASTAANQATSNTSLSSIVTNTNKLIAPSINSGTIDATTQRTVAGSAATGTKTNVASSASSVTILAANTSRKGAKLYNDSTQVCYIDETGGTASSSSFSFPVPANSMYELPGPNLYNGAITGIWAAANGNMRVTEWS